MEFLVQHYGYGQVGRWSNISNVGEDVHLGSDMWRFHTSDDRVCIYDKTTKVGGKNCHTFFLLGNGTSTFNGVDPVKSYTFGVTIGSDNEIPEDWKNEFYLPANEIPKFSSEQYDFTGRGGHSTTDFFKRQTIPRTPVDGYMSFGIVKPEGGSVTSQENWYTGNGSWTYAPYDLGKMNFDGMNDTDGMPMYFDENDTYSPGNVFNSVAYDIIVKSGMSLYDIVSKIRNDTLLDDYLADYIVTNKTRPLKINRKRGKAVNDAVFTTQSDIIHAYAGIPGSTYKGGSRAYDGGWIFYNIYVTHSLQYAHDYIDNGTPPPDGYKNTINTNGSKNIDPKFSKPKDKGDSDDPTEPDDKDNSKRDSQTIKLPKENGVSSPSNNWYQMTRSQLHRFIYYFWNDIGKNTADWFNDIQGLYNNLSEAVLGVKYFPCTSNWLYDVDPGQPPTITIGRYSTTFQATQIKSNSKLTKIGSYSIYERYNNFLD